MNSKGTVTKLDVTELTVKAQWLQYAPLASVLNPNSSHAVYLCASYVGCGLSDDTITTSGYIGSVAGMTDQ